MIIPIAYTGQNFNPLSIIIPLVIIYFILRYLYKRGKNTSPATNREFTNREQVREEKRKKRRQNAEWKKKVKKLSMLQKGDSQAKISTVIGKPDSIQKEEEESGRETWIYDCGSEGKRAITFKDGFIEKIEVKY